MPLKINRLNVTIKVKGKRREMPLHKDQKAERVTLNYALPVAQQQSHTDALPADTATEGRGSASEKPTVSAKRADPRQVADRVYELMKQEIRLAKQRHGIN